MKHAVIPARSTMVPFVRPWRIAGLSAVVLAAALLSTPADVELTGSWKATALLPGGGVSASTLQFDAAGDALKGVARLGEGLGASQKLDKIAVEGTRVTLEVRLEDGARRGLIRVVAEQSAEGRLKGSWQLLDDRGNPFVTEAWTAVKDQVNDSSPAPSAAPVDDPGALLHEIPNFALLDHHGGFHDLAYHCRTPGVKGIVLFVQGNGCPLVRKRIPELQRLRDQYQEKGILFGMINSNAQDRREEVAREAAEFNIDFPILMDEGQLVAEMLGLERTAEVLLLQAAPRKIVYRGAIDDRMSYQTERPEAENRWLTDAIDALLRSEEVALAKTDAPGCKITRQAPDTGGARFYVDHVAPILKSRCLECHSKGGIGPFAMSSWEKVRGWSEMMEEVILTKQMPPWHADPHVGTFANDQGLTTEEAKILVGWLRAGSPRGEGEDPLEGYLPERKEWQMGEPDHVIDLPEQAVPAEGVLDYRYVHVDSPFDRDVWVRVAEINPGNLRVLHHVVITAHPKDKSKRKEGRSEKWIAGYAPGTGPSPCPEGAGILLPRDSVLRFQLHYTVSGKAETDRTRLGLYLLDEKPARELHTGVVLHSKFRIPPHDNDYEESYSREIKKDILVYGLNPHMHYRGKRMRFDAVLPDGRERNLLSVPNYNFNWQRTYHPAEPIRLPAGTVLTIRNAWDNSSLNPHNPDPAVAVTWGEQSFQEMFFATYTYVEAE